MKLIDLIENHYFVERDIRHSTRLFFIVKAGVFGRWLERPPLIADLNAATINAFITHRLAVCSRETVRGERAVLRALWQFAHDAYLLDAPPSRIKPLKRERKIVEGWDRDQIRKLLEAADALTGRIRGTFAQRADYWRAVVLVAYDTGLRAGDLQQLPASCMRQAGPITVIQSKTREPVETAIGDDAVAACKKIMAPGRNQPFAIIGRRSFFEGFAAICKAAGLDGRARMLRRTSGSLVERDNPGQGHKHLGNGRDVFVRHYDVLRLSGRGPMLPPRL
jgi:integrase